MPTNKFNYDKDFATLDVRAHPEQYQVGRGEQGVLSFEPYKSEILPHWRFKDPTIARESAEAIYDLFYKYKKAKDFVGMDMARKYLQMGYTRARRYANHASGRKYKAGTSEGDENREQRPRNHDPEKAEAAEVFRGYYELVKADEYYQEEKAAHKARYG